MQTANAFQMTITMAPDELAGQARMALNVARWHEDGKSGSTGS